MCRPKSQAIFGHPPIFSECAPRRRDAKNAAKEIRGYGGDVGDEMQRGVAIAY